jgi:FixJ family two-component response regulator
MNLARETVYLVDDDEQILSGMATFLRDKHFEVRTFSDPLEFLKSFSAAHSSVIVLDMHMPTLSGLDIQSKLSEIGNHSPIFFLSGESKSQQIIDALKGGACEFFLKPVSPNILLNALNRVFEDKRNNERAITDELHRNALLRLLTPIEHQILQFFLLGHPNKMVAEAMNLKADTIKKRRAHIYEKLQVVNLPELLDHYSNISKR